MDDWELMFRFPAQVRYFPPLQSVQTACWFQPASYWMDTRGELKKTSGSVPPLPHVPSWVEWGRISLNMLTSNWILYSFHAAILHTWCIIPACCTISLFVIYCSDMFRPQFCANLRELVSFSVYAVYVSPYLADVSFVCLFPWTSAASHGCTTAWWLIVPPALDVPSSATRCPPRLPTRSAL
jgi:hypothetical protein